MSFVFLKNLIHPPSRWETPATVRPLSAHGIGHAPDSLNLSSNDKINSNIDVESQQSDICRSPQEKPSKKRKFNIDARIVSDAVLGLSDGLTVPFALTAGLAFLGDTRLVVLGGLAELIAGAISMGLGGYIGTKSEDESYRVTVHETQTLISTLPCQTHTLVQSIFAPYGLPDSTISTISKTLHDSPAMLLDFLMRFHHQLPPPASHRAIISGITIALGYFAGGFVPLLPYFCVGRSEVLRAFWVSVGVMAVALFAFGWGKTGVVRGWKGRENVRFCLRGAVQMIVVGGLAAGAAVGIIRAITHND
ncbi:hypothetical protein MMC16_007757 [Acarospora aff. strigata]|nr:hypothetical protein [Acarospora aff. strigata]